VRERHQTTGDRNGERLVNLLCVKGNGTIVRIYIEEQKDGNGGEEKDGRKKGKREREEEHKHGGGKKR